MTEKEAATETNGKERKDAKIDDETELESSIIHQVEYYFGDMNLVRDKFLREQIKLDEGWVPLDILIKFNRLAKLTTDLEAIAAALNKSTSGLLEISDDNKKVRRSPDMPLPEMNEERRKELQSRTVYVKGFPKDSALDDVLKFFKEHGDVETVIMRRYAERVTKKRLFKGSVFATFKTKDEAQSFLDKKGVKYGDTELIILWQEDYVKQKQDEYTERKNKKEQKVKDKETNVKVEKEEFKLPTGTVFHFSEATNTTKREHIRDALTALGAEVAYVDFNLGDTEGWVRLTKEGAAKELAEKLTDGKLKVEDTDVVFKVLDGDEEKTFLDKTVEELIKRRKNQKMFNRNKRGGNFKGNKGQGKKRKQNTHEDAPPTKVKVDE